MFFWFGTRLSQHPRIKSSTNVQLLFKLGDNDAWFKIKLQSLLDCKASYWSNQRSLFYSIISKSYIYNCTHFHINQYKLIIWYIILRQCYLSLMIFFFFFGTNVKNTWWESILEIFMSPIYLDQWPQRSLRYPWLQLKELEV